VPSATGRATSAVQGDAAAGNGLERPPHRFFVGNTVVLVSPVETRLSRRLGEAPSLRRRPGLRGRSRPGPRRWKKANSEFPIDGSVAALQVIRGRGKGFCHDAHTRGGSERLLLTWHVLFENVIAEHFCFCSRCRQQDIRTGRMAPAALPVGGWPLSG
jgi:hypothetical protein